MNFKEMCAQKRAEKDLVVNIQHNARCWLKATLGVLQDLPQMSLQVIGTSNVINVSRGLEVVCEFKIETGYLFRTSMFKSWRTCTGSPSYRVTASTRSPRESKIFDQVEVGVQGHKELRSAIQFWLAKMVVDNNWDKPLTTWS